MKCCVCRRTVSEEELGISSVANSGMCLKCWTEVNILSSLLRKGYGGKEYEKETYSQRPTTED